MTLPFSYTWFTVAGYLFNYCLIPESPINDFRVEDCGSSNMSLLLRL